MGKFFSDDKERMLWIRLNAERLRYAQQRKSKDPWVESMAMTGMDEMGDVDKPFTYMWISANQLDFDEKHKKELRFSFEELVMSHEDLFKLGEQRNREKIESVLRKNNFIELDDEQD